MPERVEYVSLYLFKRISVVFGETVEAAKRPIAELYLALSIQNDNDNNRNFTTYNSSNPQWS